MILSPHILTAKEGRSVAVIRHPAGARPNALRHDVVFIVGKLKLKRSGEDSEADQLARLLSDAKRWIDANGGVDIDRIPPLPGYGPIDRLKRVKRGWRDNRDRTATLIRAARQKIPRAELEARFGAKAVQLMFARWPRLRAKYPKRAPPKRGGSQILTGGAASHTLLTTLLRVARALDAQPTVEKLTTVQDPPLRAETIYRHLNLLVEVFQMRIWEDHNRRITVQDWGMFDPDRLRRSHC